MSFYVQTAGTGHFVKEAINAMTSSNPGNSIEATLLSDVQTALTDAVTGFQNAPGFTANLQVTARGGVVGNTAEFSGRVTMVQVDASGNVRMGSTGNEANKFSP